MPGSTAPPISAGSKAEALGARAQTPGRRTGQRWRRHRRGRDSGLPVVASFVDTAMRSSVMGATHGIRQGSAHGDRTAMMRTMRVTPMRIAEPVAEVRLLRIVPTGHGDSMEDHANARVSRQQDGIATTAPSGRATSAPPKRQHEPWLALIQAPRVCNERATRRRTRTLRIRWGVSFFRGPSPGPVRAQADRSGRGRPRAPGRHQPEMWIRVAPATRGQAARRRPRPRPRRC